MLGLYTSDSIRNNENASKVYQFDNKRNIFGLREINNQYKKGNSREQIVLTAYIAPRELNKVEKEMLEEMRTKDPSYYYGVSNGWSTLVTSKKNYNMVILPGKKSRKELSSTLPNYFWEENINIKFKYLNGEEMKKH